MNFKEIKELINILDNSNLTEISIEDKGTTINLKKEKEIVTQQISAPQQMVAPTVTAEPVQVNAASVDTPTTEADASLKTITAPMVGTFYKSPSPEESAYVQIGDQVTPDTTVCILEAMKLFNEIQAEVAGEIVEILVEDGQMVEYGQALFKVK
ncbi:acetyl-CoA carboxylase biotin carboxyl carrier protein [Staphylococcus pseudintermedius]|uniref:Biotin carboxyl carrier protein of acetyl-CoA carboxylase n=2 Tax=Staphylococcus pseudintermedius TaxID=283734 RepID=A0A317YUD0_STAPS|nr:acetyl-CoA carboxylase biotin carboxyl carrier protein [Staphylococcus pseudintermedius]ADV05752.1 Biotin carboxyl carrier protein of acetyl-CoA carboxylase [Staphylococcus pseudintermedius HKU10-03]ADX76538.1 acetyl-CoA carboxylase, biotin carboxyl carrier protein [Staphylococcus pseudintermedius ED99]ANS89479.1 Biotin carboxyl carrier protein of acetyl-CoA carboxylase [Staphylococcus pseudintermedius]EGQ0287267.1 acetyl-CoA carboxylase biotin carboxyl carrier protein [Staphylococcus pseudi